MYVSITNENVTSKAHFLYSINLINGDKRIVMLNLRLPPGKFVVLCVLYGHTFIYLKRS